MLVAGKGGYGKTKVNIYLIKKQYDIDNVTAWSSSQDNSRRAKREPPASKTIPGVGTLYYASTQTHTPKWVDGFFGTTVDRQAFKSATASAMLITESDGRLFALTFGFGRAFLNQNAIERHFGLRVILSSPTEAVFRKVNKTSVAGNASKMAEQQPRLSRLEDFAIENFIDTLDKADVRFEDDEVLRGTVTGGDSLAFTTEEDVHTIASILPEIMERYTSGRYKKNGYEWIDHIAPEKDKNVIKRLELETVSRLNNGLPDIWTAPPDLIDNWEGSEGFRIQGVKGIRSDILVEDLMTSLGGEIKNYQQLVNRRVELIDAADGVTVRTSWSLKRCLYGEIDLDDARYCINSGMWYRIDRDYANQINEWYKQVELYNGPKLPNCPASADEGEYNELLANSNPTDYRLADKRNISHGGGASRIELCDVLVGNDTFIHVKRYTSSAPLSHLFMQGLVSASSVLSDQVFVEKANKKLDELSKNGHPAIEAGKVSKVIYAVICKNPGEPGTPPGIPFFSRIAYKRTYETLRRYHVGCEIVTVPKEASKPAE